MEFQKTINSSNTTSDNKDFPRFVTKTKVYNQSKKITVLIKKLGLKHLLF